MVNKKIIKERIAGLILLIFILVFQNDGRTYMNDFGDTKKQKQPQNKTCSHPSIHPFIHSSIHPSTRFKVHDSGIGHQSSVWCMYYLIAVTYINYHFGDGGWGMGDGGWRMGDGGYMRL